MMNKIQIKKFLNKIREVIKMLLLLLKASECINLKIIRKITIFLLNKFFQNILKIFFK